MYFMLGVVKEEVFPLEVGIFSGRKKASVLYVRCSIRRGFST
jgi:hypothetical protein